jgi:hypothetical protein
MNPAIVATASRRSTATDNPKVISVHPKIKKMQDGANEFVIRR